MRMSLRGRICGVIIGRSEGVIERRWHRVMDENLGMMRITASYCLVYFGM